MRKKIKESNKLFDPQQVDHQEVIRSLVSESSPRRTFLVMIFISSVIATLGLLNDSPFVIIGAMLVAPLLWPVLGVSMGVIVWDWRMVRLACISILLSVFIAVVTAMVITLFYVPLGANREIFQQSHFSFMAGVAIAAGAAAAFAISYKHVKEVVTGIAISVALLPPLVTIGIGLGGSDWDLMRGATELFLVNLVAIIIVSFVIFALLGFRTYRGTMETAVRKEEKILKTK